MDRARRGFLLAKMYGTVARSFLGANYRDLLRLKSLSELQALLWPAKEGDTGPSLPAADMEARISRAAVSAMTSVLDSLEKPAEILVHILRAVERQNLKIILRGLAEGRVEASRLLDLGRWASLRVAGVTDFEGAVRASPYRWARAAAEAMSRPLVENRLDRDWFVELLRLARALPRADRTGILRYVTLQISLANVVWALRLRFAFGMDDANARPLLMPCPSEAVRTAVARVFAIPPDSLEEWRSWRYGWLLADQLGGEAFRSPDPVRAAAAASRRLAVRAHQLLHQFPFTLCPAVAYFALKQHEASLLTTVVEAVALGLGEGERASLSGGGLMLFPERMKKIELHVMKADVDAVLRHLGLAGCLQLITEAPDAEAENRPRESAAAELRLKVESVARFLGVEEDGTPVALTPAPTREDLRARAEALAEGVRDLVARETELVQRRVQLRQAADELAAFSRLKVPLSDLDQLSWLTVRTGIVSPDRLPALTERLRRRALVVPLGRPGQFMAVSPRRGRWALDSELKRAEFQESAFPAGVTGAPGEMLPAMERDLADVDLLLEGLAAAKGKARDTRRAEILFLMAHLGMIAAIDGVTHTLPSSASAQKITGWVPRRGFARLAVELDRLTQGRMALRSYDPGEIPEVRSGTARVPVSTKHGRVVGGFSRMVFSYSVPLYGTIDPTPFVAVIFVALFAIMFGDVGQGLVGLLLGVLINSGRVKALAAYRRKNFGAVFVVVGAASMLAGLLYGSVFTNEELLVPLTRLVTGRLLGTPMDRVVSLEGFQRIILFFGVTIGIGAVINTVGLVINIVNKVLRRDWELALLSKTGAAGALFFWYLLFIGVRVVLAGRPALPDFVFLGLPLAALFFREPLIHLLRGHRPLLKEGLFGFVMEGIAEVLESAIYYVSNSVSFLRVAAFALAHAVLSSIITLLADMVGSPGAGAVLSLLVIVVGNSLIIVLEGLIVTIQVVRLQYYEFFSKFFTDAGEEFTPFILRAPGGSL